MFCSLMLRGTLGVIQVVSVAASYAQALMDSQLASEDAVVELSSIELLAGKSCIRSIGKAGNGVTKRVAIEAARQGAGNDSAIEGQVSEKVIVVDDGCVTRRRMC